MSQANPDMPLIARSELPEDPSDWGEVSVSFERLAEDRAASCPTSEDDVFEYVQMESADGPDAERARLRFLRTARVSDARYWMWTYREADGCVNYVVLRSDTDGSIALGMSESNGLSPEQYLLADYYDEIYWP